MKLREENSASIDLSSYSNAIPSPEEACPCALPFDRPYLFVSLRLYYTDTYLPLATIRVGGV